MTTTNTTADVNPSTVTDPSVTDGISADLLVALDQASADLLEAERFHDHRLTSQAIHDERARMRTDAVQRQASAVADIAARAGAAAEAAHGQIEWFDGSAQESASLTASWQFLLQPAFESERATDWEDAIARATADDLAAALRYGPASFRRRWATAPERSQDAINRLEAAVDARWFEISDQRPAVAAFETAANLAAVAANTAAQFASGRVRQTSDVGALTGAIRVAQTRALGQVA